MKKLILSLIACIPLMVNGQTSPKDSTLVFPVKLADAQIEAEVMPDGSSVIIAIARAAKGVTDTSQIIYPIITQSELVSVASTNRLQSEGVMADLNKRLFATAINLFSGRPWLTSQLLAIRDGNFEQVESMRKAGSIVLNNIYSTWSRVSPQ